MKPTRENGCSCPSCRYTHSFKRFADWPKGEPAGQLSSERAYRAHVAHSFYGAKVRTEAGPRGAAFYGTPAGMTKKQVEEVLRRTFAQPAPAEAEAMAA